MLTRSREALILDKPVPSDNHKWFRLVTCRKDSHGTVILPDGGDLSRHKQNPLFLWMHQSGPSKARPVVPGPEVAIGTVEEYVQTPELLDILVRFDDREELGRKCRDKVTGGFLRSCSVGFDPEEGGEEEVTVGQEQAALWPGTVVGEKLVVIRRWVLLEASLVILGSNEDALAYLRSLDPPDQVRAPAAPAAVATLPAEPGNVSKEKKPMANQRAAKMSPECRWMQRSLVSHNMDTAEQHMRLMEHAPEEHRAHHKAQAGEQMERAMKHAEMLREAVGEDEPDGDERSRRTVGRVVPDTVGDADLRTRFRQVAEKVAALEVEPLGVVCQKVLGTSDPDEVDTRTTALVETQTRYRELRTQKKAEASDVEATAREAKIVELQDDPAVRMSPAVAARARTEKWKLTKLAAFEAEARKDGPPVEIVRTRALRSVEDVGEGGTLPGVRTPTQPAVPKTPAGGESRAADAWAEFGKTMGLDPEKIRSKVVATERQIGFHQ